MFHSVSAEQVVARAMLCLGEDWQEKLAAMTPQQQKWQVDQQKREEEQRGATRSTGVA
jgi:hypothetical protein